MAGNVATVENGASDFFLFLYLVMTKSPYFRLKPQAKTVDHGDMIVYRAARG